MNPREYEPQIGALLRMARTALQDELYAQLRNAGFADLREVHRPLLRYPPIDGMRPTELATDLALSKQATNDLLRDMEAIGYLHLERGPSDGRARLIRYTKRGWQLYDTGSRISRDIGQSWATAIGQRRYDDLLASLRTIVDLPRSP
jgi:DNA-binding MarR family transcriptional regulator